MRFLLSVGLICGFTSAAFAEDLPNNALITNRSSEVTIYSVEQAKVTHDLSRVSDANGHRVIKVEAALEFSLNVEGNLCSSKPEDIVINTVRSENGDVSLALSRRYTTDPFSDILSACLAYSAPRDVTVAIRINDYAFDEGYEKNFLVATGNDFNRALVQVNVRYDDVLGLQVTVNR